MTLGPGAILGQLALVEDGLRDASVICTRDCEFLRIESAELAEIQKIELQRTEKEQQQTLEFFYHHLPLLQSLPETTALATVEHFEKHEFPLRHVFFQQEEHGDGAYYLIMNGSVELFVADTPQFFDNTHLPHTGFRRLGMLMKGCLFASNGPKGKEAFTAVVASSPCEIWRLGRGNFKHVPEVILKALHELSDQNTLWRMSRVGSLPILEATGSHGTLGLDYRPHTTLKGPPLGLRLNWNSRPSQTLRASAYQTSNSFIGKLPQVSRSPKARSCARTAGSWRPQDSQLKLTTRDPFLPPEPEYVEFVMTPGACLALHGRRPKKRAHKLALSRPASLPHLR
jgi:CRP-like cAMP-binding protein